MSLVETMVALGLLLMVSMVFLPIMDQTTDRTREIDDLNQALDQGRIALKSIDREFRGADRLCSPTTQTPGANTLTFRTRSSAGTYTDKQRVDYRYVAASGELQRSENNGTTWRPVVGGVVNGPTQPVFTVEHTTEPSAGEIVTVDLWIDTNTNDALSSTQLTTRLTARNIFHDVDLRCSYP
jgi:type II secretory pathway pseudopilin PulG